MDEEVAALAFLLATSFLGAMGIGLVAPVLPFLVARYAEPAQVAALVGVLSASYAAAAFVAAPILGTLGDRFGRKPILVVSLFGSSAGYLIFGCAGAFWMLVVGRLVDGFTAGNFSTVFAALSDRTAPDARGRVFGYVGAAAGAGIIAGPAIGGLLARLGTSAPFYVAAAIACANAIFGMLFMQETRPRDRAIAPLTLAQLNPIAQLRSVMAMREVRPLLWSSMLFTIPFAMMGALIGVLAKDSLHWSPTAVSTVFIVVGVCDVAVQGFALGRLSRRVGERRAAVIGLGLCALGTAGMAAVTALASSTVLVVAVGAFAIGEGIFTACLASAISKRASEEHQGRVQGGSQSLQSAMQVCGPIVGGLLYTSIAPAAPYVLGVAFVMLAARMFVSVPETGPRHSTNDRSSNVA
jgi:DHA1 family tetracycline resistance protein-like MFS transporter